MTSVLKNILVLLAVLCSFVAIAQEDDISKRKEYNDAIKLLNNGEFEKALPKFLLVDSIEEGKSFMTKYYIGICYLKTKYDKTKAIPYLEFAISKDKFLIEDKVYIHVGNLFHLDYNFEKAISSFEIYKRKAGKAGEDYEYAERMIEICKNALIHVPDSVNIEIEKETSVINTKHSEYGALVSADESIIYFTRQVNPDILSKGEKLDTLEHIFVTYLKNKKWSEPQELVFTEAKGKNISLAGLSADGEQLFVNMDGDLYFTRVTEGKFSALTKMGAPINTEHYEGTASLTADGRQLYFSSNRPGGMGGNDIYRSEKADDGSWGIPENLGEAINTVYDEVAPFIHPDKQRLYFSSKGHSTIGGFDIFQAYYLDDSWTQPRNMGYPINTVKNDINFILSGSGKHGYFSSDKENKYFCHDLYKLILKKSIPLTMIKGRITAGDPAVPVKANIRVVDKETGERVKYIYNPNPTTGKYLMIFPPGKNYDMVVEAKGFLPHMINIYIPDQEYFYELFQEIHLEAVTAMGETVGEEITVKNTFFDVDKAAGDTTAEGKTNKDYSQLLNLIDNIIMATDSLGEEEMEVMSESLLADATETSNAKANKNFEDLFNMIEDAIETTDSTSLAKIEKNTLYEDEASQKFLYTAGDKNANLVAVVFGKDTIWTTPALVATTQNPMNSFEVVNNAQAPKDVVDVRVPDNYKRVILTYYIEFEKGDSKVSEKSTIDIKDICDLAMGYNRLGIDMVGTADVAKEVAGDRTKANTLASDRVWSATEALLAYGVESNRIVSEKWDGNAIKEAPHQRIVELKLFEVMDEPLFELMISETAVIDFNEEELKVEEIKAGQEIRLSNIFFAYASAELTAESSEELLNVVKFLNNNKTIRIEIGGHTDNIGTDIINLQLSKQRAQSVVDFLVKQGIAADRLVVKGYGSSKPIAYNTTEEGRKQNRRVVFTILEK